MNDTALRRLLERIADLTVLGLLTILAGATVLGGLAGLTATATVLTERAGTGSIPTQWCRALRRHGRATIPLQLLWCLMSVVAIADLMYVLSATGASGPLDWAELPVLVVGMLMLLTAVGLPPYVALFQAAEGTPWPTTLRRAALTAAARPGTVGLVIAMSGIGFALAMVLPVLGPLIVGTHVLVCVTVVSRTMNRALRPRPSRSTPRQPTLNHRRISLS